MSTSSQPISPEARDSNISQWCTTAFVKLLQAKAAIERTQTRSTPEISWHMLSESLEHLKSLDESLGFAHRQLQDKAKEVAQATPSPPHAFDDTRFLDRLQAQGLVMVCHATLLVKFNWKVGGETELYNRMIGLVEAARKAVSQFREATDAVYQCPEEGLPGPWSWMAEDGMPWQALSLRALKALQDLTVYWGAAELFILEARRLEAGQASLLEDIPQATVVE